MAIRDAFNAARHRLENYMRRRRGKVKRHRPVEVPAHAQRDRQKPG